VNASAAPLPDTVHDLDEAPLGVPRQPSIAGTGEAAGSCVQW